MSRTAAVGVPGAILAMFVFTFASAAQEGGSASEEGKTPEPFDVTVIANQLRLVTGNDFPPFADQDLPGGGMITDLVTTALTEADVSYDLAYEDWVRGRVLTLYATYDATFPYVRTLEREALFYFSKPLFTMDIRWYAAKDASVSEITSEWLQGKRLCKPDGYYLSDVQQYVISRTVDLQFAPTMEACLKRVVDGKADLVSGSALVVEGTIRSTASLEPSSFKSLPSDSEATLHVIVSKFNPLGLSILDRINDAIDALSDSQVEEIRTRHLDAYRQRIGLEQE